MAALPRCTRRRSLPGGRIPKLEPRNHWFDFVDCCIAGDAKKKPTANFDYAGPLTEAVLLGCLASIFPKQNTRMERGEDGVHQLRGRDQVREAKLSSGVGDRGVVNAPVPPRGIKLRRLDQLLSSLGHGSRRDARECIRNGLVTVRGTVEDDPGAKVDAHDVLVEGEPLEAPDGLLAILHKPAGYICTHSEEEGSTIYDLLPERWTQRNPAVTSVGRLDKDTSGILMVTDRGDLVQQWTSPRSVVEKVYEVEVDAPLETHLIADFRQRHAHAPQRDHALPACEVGDRGCPSREADADRGPLSSGPTHVREPGMECGRAAPLALRRVHVGWDRGGGVAGGALSTLSQSLAGP